MNRFDHFKKNLIPGIILWIFSLLLIISYYYIIPCHNFLNSLGALKNQYGVVYSAVSTLLFGAIIPSCILFFRQKISLSTFIFFLIYWGYKGVEVDLLYRFQGFIFGYEQSLVTMFSKMFFDQFIYTPIWSAPSVYFIYRWKNLGFNFSAVFKEMNLNFYKYKLLTILISTWIVWVPAVLVIYSFPASLQIPLFNFVLCFWALVLELLISNNAENSTRR